MTTFKKYPVFLVYLILALVDSVVFAQTSQTITTPGTTTWVAPVGVTQIQVEAWGGGGGGGNSNNTATNGGSGGGGGAYSKSILNVVPGTTYTLYVGSGGVGAPVSSTVVATNGEDTWFSSSVTSLLAKGGTRGFNSNNSTTQFGSGGLAGDGVGSIRYSGGNGGRASASAGGGGGSSAAAQSGGLSGGDASGATPGAGGIAPTSGGNGGAGSGAAGTNGGNGFAGSTPGGGGGGSDDVDTRSGGNGAAGQVVIEWFPRLTIDDNSIPENIISASSNGANIPIHSFTMLGEFGNGSPNYSLSEFSFTTSGTYLVTDIKNFKLYYTTTNEFSADNLIATINTPAVAGVQSFPTFSANFDFNTTYYLWVTVDLTRSALNDRTIQVSATSTSNFTSSITKYGSAEASGLHTFGRGRIFYNNTTWKIPDCVTEIEIEVWGAGGGGGGSSANDWSGASGGGGGGYSKSILTVTPGTVYNIFVGQGGAAGSSVPAESGTGGTGGDSWMSSPTSTIILAKGGLGGLRDPIPSSNGTYQFGALGRAGGLAGDGIGTIRFSGGSGGNGWHGAFGQGGGGGTSAGVSTNGINGNFASYTSPPPISIAPAGGGDGGIGGGGGGGAGGDPGRSGGQGANGKIAVSWIRTRTFNGSDTWTAPPGVTSVDVQVWGAGGAGGSGNNTLEDSQGGGGGGAYSSSTVFVVPGSTYSVHIGTGGGVGAANGGNGGDSWISVKADGTVPANILEGVLAKGGMGGTYGTTGGIGGLGGQSSDGIGSFKASGGNGGNGANGDPRGGGGGGASAGSGGNGGNGGNGGTSIAGAGGAAPAGGFSGGNGGFDDNTDGAGGCIQGLSATRL